MMKTTRTAALILFLFSQNAGFVSACTIFQSPFPGDGRVSHNVDWYALAPDVKGIFVLNPAGLKKTAELLGAPIKAAEWTSKLNSATFSIGGAEFPVAGFNEKGLFMAVLMFSGAEYPPATDPRPAIGTGQFVQYNLDVSENIDQVIQSDKKLRPYGPSFKFHYFACDSSGACAVLQYINGQLKVFRGGDLPYPMLTNSLYSASVDAARGCTAQSCDQANNSLWRFAQAALKRGEMTSSAPYLDQASGVLDHVAQTGGILTQFQLTYDPKRSTMLVRKKGAAKYGSLTVSLSGLSCAGPRRIIVLDGAPEGDLSGSWQDLTQDMQQDIARKSGVPAVLADKVGRYPFESVSCLNSAGSAPSAGADAVRARVAPLIQIDPAQALQK